jgi:hypothetical protein
MRARPSIVSAALIDMHLAYGRGLKAKYEKEISAVRNVNECGK